MIYVLLLNGASAAPLFAPILLQLLLVVYTALHFRPGIVAHNPVKYIYISISIFILLVSITAILRLELDLSLKFTKTFVNSVFSVTAATALIYRYGDTFAEAYTNAIVKLTLIGILGLCLTLITDWSILANIGERNYFTNLLTVWITDGDFNSSHAYFGPFKYRLQSFFDEPGTFGIILIPAFYYATYNKQTVNIALLSIGIFLTESINAWAVAFIIGAYFLFQSNSKTFKFLFLTLIFVLGAEFFDVFSSLYAIKMGIDDAYSNSSSFGTRSLEYQYVINNLLFHALPLSNIRYAADHLSGISSAYIQWIIYGGWAFIMLLFSGMIAIGALCLKIRKNSRSNNYFSLVLAASLFISGFQRTSVLDNVLFMTLFYWSLYNLYPQKRTVFFGIR